MKQNTQNCITNEMTINQTVREALALALLKLMEKQEFDKILGPIEVLKYFNLTPQIFTLVQAQK